MRQAQRRRWRPARGTGWGSSTWGRPAMRAAAARHRVGAPRQYTRRRRSRVGGRRRPPRCAVTRRSREGSVCDEQRSWRPVRRHGRLVDVVGAGRPVDGGIGARGGAASYRCVRHGVRLAAVPAIAVHAAPTAGTARRTTGRSGCATTAAPTAAAGRGWPAGWRCRRPNCGWGRRCARGVLTRRRTGRSSPDRTFCSPVGST